MNKKNLYSSGTIILTLSLSLLLSGCWSYRGLDEIEIVSGMAIDKGSGDKNYKITMEIFDVSGSSKEGAKQKIIQSEGQTIFDAVRNANKKLLRRPYFSHMEVIYIDKNIAQEEGLYSILDFFLRDGEMRDTLYFTISQEDSAEALFQGEPADSPILSVQIGRSIQDDKKITSATYDSNLITAYKNLTSPGIAMVLPAIHLTDSQDTKVAELNGISIFAEDKLKGFITPEETKFFLMIMDELDGGILPVQVTKDPLETIDLEIVRSKTKQSFKYTSDQIEITLEPQLLVFLGGINFPIESINEEDIHRFESLGEEFIINQTNALIKKVQNQYGIDIFGFGNLIYRKEPKLWQQLSNEWDQYFTNLQVEIKPKVTILNTAFVRNNSSQAKHQ